jgi:hypothetical protein
VIDDVEDLITLQSVLAGVRGDVENSILLKSVLGGERRCLGLNTAEVGARGVRDDVEN